MSEIPCFIPEGEPGSAVSATEANQPEELSASEGQEEAEYSDQETVDSTQRSI